MVRVKNSFQTNQEKFSELLTNLKYLKQIFPGLILTTAGYSGGVEIYIPIRAEDQNDIFSYTEDHTWDTLGKSKYITKFKVGLVCNEPDNRTALSKFFGAKQPQSCFGVLELGFSTYSKKPNRLLIRVFGEKYFTEIAEHYKNKSEIKDTTIILESLHSMAI